LSHKIAPIPYAVKPITKNGFVAAASKGFPAGVEECTLVIPIFINSWTTAESEMLDSATAQIPGHFKKGMLVVVACGRIATLIIGAGFTHEIALGG
jgi:hypothetical protein